MSYGSDEQLAKYIANAILEKYDVTYHRSQDGIADIVDEEQLKETIKEIIAGHV